MLERPAPRRRADADLAAALRRHVRHQPGEPGDGEHHLQQREDARRARRDALRQEGTVHVAAHRGTSGATICAL
jgi:hypothetical protein